MSSLSNMDPKILFKILLNQLALSGKVSQILQCSLHSEWFIDCELMKCYLEVHLWNMIIQVCPQD